MVIMVKKLHPEAQLPMRAHRGDAGADLTAVTVERKILKFRGGKETEVLVCGSGLAFAIPEGCWLDLRARSGIYKTGMCLCNSIGTIDNGYRGEVKGMFYFAGHQSAEAGAGEPELPEAGYQPGDRFAQIVVMPAVPPEEVEFVETDELPASTRGTGGFGSTGR